MYQTWNIPVYNYNDLFTRQVAVQQQNSDMSAEDRNIIGFFLNVLSISPVNSLGSSALLGAGGSAMQTSAVIEGQKEAARGNQQTYNTIPAVIPFGRNGMCTIRYPNGRDDAWFLISTIRELDIDGDRVIEHYEVKGLTDNLSASSGDKYYFRNFLPARRLPDGSESLTLSFVRKDNNQVMTKSETGGVCLDFLTMSKPIESEYTDYYAIWQHQNGTTLAIVPFRITR